MLRRLPDSKIASQGPLHSLQYGSVERVFKQPPSWRVGHVHCVYDLWC